MKHQYIGKDERKPISAIQWTGDNQNEVWLWALEIKRETASVGQTSYAHLGAALLVHIDATENCVGNGAWLLWRDGHLEGVADAQFRQQFEPVSFHYPIDWNQRSDEEQRRQGRRCAEAMQSVRGTRKPDVPQPQACASDASQGIVEPQKCQEEAEPEYIIRFVRNYNDFELMLNYQSRLGYELKDWGVTGDEHTPLALILHRRD